MWKLVSRYFINGLLTLLPLFVTLWLLWIMFSFLDGFLGPIVTAIVGFPIPGLGLLSAVVLIFLFGAFITIFGKRLFGFAERLLHALPLVNTIYSAAKQLRDIVFLQTETVAFRKVCAVEWPRKGVYSIGFITGKGVHQIQDETGEDLVTVFVPSTPTPATGFAVVVPKKEVIPLELTLDEAIKFVVSGGVLTSPKKVKEAKG